MREYCPGLREKPVESLSVYGREDVKTLVVTIPVMLALYLVIHNEKIFVRGEYFWFPFLIFTSLALFSVLTLVYYKET